MTDDRPLRDIAEQAIGGGDDIGRPPWGFAFKALAAASLNGKIFGSEAARLTRELVKVVAGSSTVAPPKGDKRFADPAWSANPVYRRIMQTYLVSSAGLDRIVDQWQYAEEDVTRAQAARFAAAVLTGALAPTNYLLANPAAVKEAFDTAGLSLARGLRNYASDLRHNGGMPSMTEPGAFKVAVDLAITPGSVASRDTVAELLQYTPSTETVYQRPVLVVPPPIGRYYFLDLRPGRSFVEYSVARGLRTFLLSWRNPQAEQADWTLDTYAARVSDALDEIRARTGSDDVNVIGFCAGGIITTTLLNHLAAHGDTRIHSVAYAVTMLDFRNQGQLAAFAVPRLLKFAEKRSARRGVITAREMSSAFTWMRPNDLVFNYVVNNYLMGRKPPKFDILAWNADGTNLPGSLHGQFLDIFANNSLVQPGAMEVLGTPLHLDRIKAPIFVVGAIDDHLTDWKNCYLTTQLLGSSDRTFLLSYSGHIASLVNPPGNPKAHYWVGDKPGPDPELWRTKATKRSGSWWEAWADWATARAGASVSAPGDAANPEDEMLGAAPGLYVRDLEPASAQAGTA